MAEKKVKKREEVAPKKSKKAEPELLETSVYRDWQIQPHVIDPVGKLKARGNVIWKRMDTRHEGEVLYYKLWNFWVRAGVEADMRSSRFFRDYETANAETDALLRDIGFTWSKAETEEEVWSRIGMLWNWLRSHVVSNNAEYATISSVPGEWPSIVDFARHYKTHGRLAWAACFSKAHLFATLLGRIIYPRYRFAVASAHHTENGAPPTATHVFVAVYVGERWYYLDPTAISTPFPDYAHRRSIGVGSFASVDYEHPYMMLPVPLSGFDGVPYLPA
jgi:hypothetical protein